MRYSRWTMDAGERLAIASLLVNILVTGLKYFLGVFSGSLALLADAVHSTADVISSASIWAGIRLSRRKTLPASRPMRST
jgi:divalent metal cation (Fe/Co/Zn/Cd) transporter